MEQSYEALCALLREYTVFLETMRAQEEAKLEAVLKADLEKLEQVLTSQQAAQKQLEQFEKLRCQRMEQAGVSGETLSQFICRLPTEKQGEMKALLQRMQEAAKQTQFCNRKALDIVTMNLKSISFIEERSGQESGYTQDRRFSENEKNNPALFNAKV